jgi:hypothetical protein
MKNIKSINLRKYDRLLNIYLLDAPCSQASAINIFHQYCLLPLAICCRHPAHTRLQVAPAEAFLKVAGRLA